MKKSILVSFFTLLCVCLTVSGCGKKAPGCADEEVKELVMEIAQKNYLGLFSTDYWDGIEDIRTQSTDEEVGRCYCAANLRISWRPGDGWREPTKPGSRTMPVEYTAERTADDGRLYVTVFGL